MMDPFHAMQLGLGDMPLTPFPTHSSLPDDVSAFVWDMIRHLPDDIGPNHPVGLSADSDLPDDVLPPPFGYESGLPDDYPSSIRSYVVAGNRSNREYSWEPASVPRRMEPQENWGYFSA